MTTPASIKSYSDLEGDGGSNVAEQVQDQKAGIEKKLSGIKHMLAIASGKGGVGKSTMAMQIASALNQRGLRVSVLDADINGPSMARLAGLKDAPLVPGKKGLVLPRTKSGIGILSFGSMVPESEAVDFPSVSGGESHVWRATKEFSTLAEFLRFTEWGELDFLLIDLPPGAERCFQFAEFFGKRATFVMVTIPSKVAHGVVSRSIAAIKKAGSPMLGYIENMKGYYCADCGEIKTLFPEQNAKLNIPLLGSVPFDPELAENCDRGISIPQSRDQPDSPAAKAVNQIVDQIQIRLEEKL